MGPKGGRGDVAASGGQGHSSQRHGGRQESAAPLCVQPSRASVASPRLSLCQNSCPPTHTHMYAHTRNIDTCACIYTQAPQLKPITFGKCQFKYYLLWKTGQLPAPSPILVILSSQPYTPPPHSPQHLSDDTAITCSISKGLPPDCELCGSVPSVVPQSWTALSAGRTT